VQLNIASGVLSIIATVLIAGCSTTAPTYSLSTKSLNHYQVDCSNKHAQIRYIQSMRPTNQQRNVASGIATIPFAWMFDYGNYTAQRDVAHGRKDWMLNQILMELDRCP